MLERRKYGSKNLALFIRVIILLCAFRVGLYFLSFSALCRFAYFLSSFRVRKKAQVSVEVLSWAVSGVSRFVPQATCLTQALTLHVLLRRRRFESKIHIGVAKKEGELFESHAWVESGGRVVIGDLDLKRFTSMVVLQ